jgi:hypothetical protein
MAVKFEGIQDTVKETSKVTTGYFTGGVGTVLGSTLVTASLASSQKEYFYRLTNSDGVAQLSVSYGHLGGSGSTDAGTGVDTKVGQTEAVYKQFSSILLKPSSNLDTIGDNVAKGFVFNTGSSNTTYVQGAGAADADMYFITLERSLMKDRLNKKNWTIILSGSIFPAVGDGTAASFIDTGSTLSLTDDSNTVEPYASPVGPRYNVVEGTLGSVTTAATTKIYGYVYPNVGVIALRAQELSASLPGSSSTLTSTVTETKGIGFGMDTTRTADNALKMVNSMQLGEALTFRSEEDQTTTSYFCQARAGDFNFSNNPTFTSGSFNRMTQASMEGNPQTFISTIGLYNTAQELLAVGKLSTPVQKNFSKIATFKVNLTY